MGHDTARFAESRLFDQTARRLATGSSRRTVVRGLAAGLIAATGGGIATGAVDARKKKKRKKKSKKQTPNPTQTPTPTPTPTPVFCPQGTSVAHLSVRADGSQTFTPILQKGQAYILRAYGYWSTNGDYMNDAFAAFLWKDQRSPVMYNNGVRLGLAVNGESPDLWGSYNQSHTYHLVVIGKGEPVSLQMLDSVYSDNGRDLYVEVLCGAPID